MVIGKVKIVERSKLHISLVLFIQIILPIKCLHIIFVVIIKCGHCSLWYGTGVNSHCCNNMMKIVKTKIVKMKIVKMKTVKML